MQLLCLSNGHGEDAIGLRIVQALRQTDDRLEVAALPIVGTGQSYQQQGVPLIGTAKVMPSGGFVYMDGRQLVRDLQGGLLPLTLAQLRSLRQWAQREPRSGRLVLAVGDVVPLLFAYWSGAPYAFVGTAKSEYYLRDEAGVLTRATWFEQLEGRLGSVYSPVERWLMTRKRCRAVFCRDRLTHDRLLRFGIPSQDLGNPMMDGLEPIAPDSIPKADRTILLLPGSRPPEAYANWELILSAIAHFPPAFPGESLLFLAAIVPSLDQAILQESLLQAGWTATPDGYCRDRATLQLSSSRFNDFLDRADLAIAMAGTATEQAVGLGKPVLTIAGAGPQFTPAFAEAQTRLLGESVIWVDRPGQLAHTARTVLTDADRLRRIAANGQRRMGAPGAADRIARALLPLL